MNQSDSVVYRAFTYISINSDLVFFKVRGYYNLILFGIVFYYVICSALHNHTLTVDLDNSYFIIIMS